VKADIRWNYLDKFMVRSGEATYEIKGRTFITKEKKDAPTDVANLSVNFYRAEDWELAL